MNQKTLKVIETMDNPTTHCKSICASASEVIVFIALVFSNISLDDKPVTLVLFICIIINSDNASKAVVHTNTAWTSSTKWTISVKNVSPGKYVSRVNETKRTTTTLPINRFNDFFLAAISSSMFMTSII